MPSDNPEKQLVQVDGKLKTTLSAPVVEILYTAPVPLVPQDTPTPYILPSRPCTMLSSGSQASVEPCTKLCSVVGVWACAGTAAPVLITTAATMVSHVTVMLEHLPGR